MRTQTAALLIIPLFGVVLLLYWFIFNNLAVVLWVACGSWAAALATWVELRVYCWCRRRRKERQERERIPRAVVR